MKTNYLTNDNLNDLGLFIPSIFINLIQINISIYTNYVSHHRINNIKTNEKKIYFVKSKQQFNILTN